jgi:hypothetical protein
LSADDDILSVALGRKPHRILCLTEPGGQNRSSSKEKCVQFAVHASNFPARLGLDWSHAATWNLPEIIMATDAALTAEDAVVETFRRRGSIAAYDSVRPEYLRARLRTSDATQPQKWLRFVDIADHLRLYRE